MILGSHNSWTYLKPKKWWMRLIGFMAKCQSEHIITQYFIYGVRCFDLRIRFNKSGDPVLAHGIIEYDYDEVLKTLSFLNGCEDCIVRILHESRNKEQYNPDRFREYCSSLEKSFPKIKFFCGRNLYNWKVTYNFRNYYTVKEYYASVCKPQLIDDWWPWLFAKFNNKNIPEYIEEEILLIDYIQYKENRPQS